MDTESRPGVTVEHPNVIGSVAFRPDGKVFLTASADGRSEPGIGHRPSGRPAPVASCRGRGVIDQPRRQDRLDRLRGSLRAAMGPGVGTAIGKPIEHQAEVSCCGLQPERSDPAHGQPGPVARLWDASTRKPLSNRCFAGGQIDAGAFSPDGKTVAIGTSEGHCPVLGCRDRGREWAVHLAPWGRECRGLSPDGKTSWSPAKTAPPSFGTSPHDHRRRRRCSTRAGSSGLPSAPTVRPFSPGAKTAPRGFGTPQPAFPSGPLSAPQLLSTVAFSPDGTMILTGATITRARLLPIVADHSEPLEILESGVGLHRPLLDSSGSVQVLDNETWRSRRDQVRSRGQRRSQRRRFLRLPGFRPRFWK